MAGIIGGLIFAVFEVNIAAAMMGAGAAFMPLRMIGGIALGAQALDPGYPLITAASAGVKPEENRTVSARRRAG